MLSCSWEISTIEFQNIHSRFHWKVLQRSASFLWYFYPRVFCLSDISILGYFYPRVFELSDIWSLGYFYPRMFDLSDISILGCFIFRIIVPTNGALHKC